MKNILKVFLVWAMILPFSAQATCPEVTKLEDVKKAGYELAPSGSFSLKLEKLYFGELNDFSKKIFGFNLDESGNVAFQANIRNINDPIEREAIFKDEKGREFCSYTHSGNDATNLQQGYGRNLFAKKEG